MTRPRRAQATERRRPFGGGAVFLHMGIVLAGVLHGSPAPGFTPTATHERLSDTVHLIQMHHREGGHVNTLLSAGEDGALLVDHAGDWKTMTCPPAMAAAFARTIREAGGDRPLRYLVNTHWHGDHTAGNEIYGREAVIIAHASTRRRLMEAQAPWWRPEGIRALEPHGWPDVTFDNSLTIHFNGEAIRLYFFGEAHTDGDAVIHFTQSNVVHVGDLFQGPEALAMPGDPDGLVLALEAIARRVPRDARVVTGHGGVSTVDAMRRFQAMLAASVAHVRARLREGADLEAIREDDLPEPWAGAWSGDRAQVGPWLEAIARALSDQGRAGGP